MSTIFIIIILVAIAIFYKLDILVVVGILLLGLFTLTTDSLNKYTGGAGLTNTSTNKSTNQPIKYYIHDSVLDGDFKQITSDILANSGWRAKHSIEEVSDESTADVLISLETDEFLDKWHDKKDPIRFSMTWQGPKVKPKIYINYANWQGTPRSKLSLSDYREYVIEHEFGHALGYDHLLCKLDGAYQACPVMYQSTRGCPGKCGQRPDDRDFNADKLDFRYFKNI